MSFSTARAESNPWLAREVADAALLDALNPVRSLISRFSHCEVVRIIGIDLASRIQAGCSSTLRTESVSMTAPTTISAAVANPANMPSERSSAFNRLLRTHWQTLPEDSDAADLDVWMAPGGWIALFCSRMQELLMAELELRLQPVVGLIESIF